MVNHVKKGGLFGKIFVLVTFLFSFVFSFAPSIKHYQYLVPSQMLAKITVEQGNTLDIIICLVNLILALFDPLSPHP